jgi:hypothetical protein
MNLFRSDAPAVWVLVFDRRPTHGEFDRLDLESTYFEQFLLQDVRSDIAPHLVFGGEPAFSELARQMTALDQKACLVTLTTDTANCDVKTEYDFTGMESFMRRNKIPFISTDEQDSINANETNTSATDAATLDQAFLANLVWIEARISTSSRPDLSATNILNSIYDRLSSLSGTEQQRPILIVTFRSGNDISVREPLKCGITENSINVPLWIRSNLGHACRVQALTGSFDLLPTIATFLNGSAVSDKLSPPDVAQISDLSDMDIVTTPLSSESQSLAFLCGAPQVCLNRLLLLRGDGWRAARTEGFMLVNSDTTELDRSQRKSDGDSSEEPSRRLYVKPDDRFNVNDVGRTYAMVVEELAEVLKSLDN